MTPIWIAEADVPSLIDMRGAIRALEGGLRAEARGAALNMTKTHVAWSIGSDHATLHAIGAAFPAEGFAGTKTWAHTPGGASPLVILYDSRTGALRAIIEAFALGQLRTGAASAIATDRLADPRARELAIVGTGKQSLSQIAAVNAVRPLARVRMVGRDPARLRRAADRVRAELGLEVVELANVGEAVAGAPIVTTVTRAREPFLFAAMLDPGTHVNAVGAIVQTGAEIARDVLARSTKIAVDSVEAARKLSRELIEFFGHDEAGWAAVRRLADLVATDTRRTTDDDVTLFKSLGMGVSDLSLAIEVYRAAERMGIGSPIEAGGLKAT